MIVHTFDSIAEIQAAPEGKERETAKSKVLEESITFDRAVHAATELHDGAQRNEALLRLEELPEFVRSHPTVEVRHAFRMSLWCS